MFPSDSMIVVKAKIAPTGSVTTSGSSNSKPYMANRPPSAVKEYIPELNLQYSAETA